MSSWTAVVEGIFNSFIVMILKGGKDLSFVAQRVQGVIPISSEMILLFAIINTPAQQVLTIIRVGVEESNQSDLLADVLKVCGDCVGYETTKRPTQQLVGAGRLNSPNLFHIVAGHLFKSLWTCMWLQNGASL